MLRVSVYLSKTNVSVALSEDGSCCVTTENVSTPECDFIDSKAPLEDLVRFS
jgi:hypothetical protein